MTVRLKRTVLIILAALPLVSALIALAFLPDTIPSHFDLSFRADRFGSKYEALIFPIITLIVLLIMLFATRVIPDDRNKRVMLNIGIALGVVMDLLFFYILYLQLNSVSDAGSIPLSVERVTLLLFGGLFIFIGNLMPMTKMNSAVGLRTSWSMKNETVWKKCQLFGGVALMIVGALCVVFAFVWPSIFVMPALAILAAVVCTVYSYLAAKKYA